MTQRPDWNFRVTSGIGIPCEDEQADFVCFFSVFTHLVHEETFEYLREARRVLKPGGKIVFSFLPRISRRPAIGTYFKIPWRVSGKRARL